MLLGERDGSLMPLSFYLEAFLFCQVTELQFISNPDQYHIFYKQRVSFLMRLIW